MQHDAMHDHVNVCHPTRKISRICCLDTTTRSGGTFQAELNAGLHALLTFQPLSLEFLADLDDIELYA